MSKPVSLDDRSLAQGRSRASVEIFDPPMCCPTGMCGPTVDKTLLSVNEMVLALQERGVEVRRYQMASQPSAFLRNREVYQLLQKQQMAALPITVVNGQVIKVGAYPALSEIENALNGEDS